MTEIYSQRRSAGPPRSLPQLRWAPEFIFCASPEHAPNEIRTPADITDSKFDIKLYKILHGVELERLNALLLLHPSDMTPNSKQLAKGNEFFETPDGLGYFKLSRTGLALTAYRYNAYVEIVSYRKNARGRQAA